MPPPNAPQSGRRGRAALPGIVQGAARVFADWGLSRTQMHDVATEAGVAPGTLYLHAKSKEALFDLALRYGLGESDAFLADIERPYAAEPEHTLELLRERGRTAAFCPVLEADLSEPLPRGRFVELIADLHDALASHRYAIRAVERSAREWAELAYVFIEECREPLVRRLAQSLEIHDKRGDIRLPGSAATSARLVVEYTSWSAVHRHFDGADIDFDGGEIRATTLQFLLGALSANPVRD